MGGFSLRPITADDVRDILTWRYPPPYDFYDPPLVADEEGLISQFLDPELRFHAIIRDDGVMAGFCSFGTDGQVEGGDYSLPALDVGLGMKPELTGQGSGRAFVKAIVAFADHNYVVSRLRLTVARFNQRAMHLYQSLGFEPVDQFTDPKTQIPYVVLLADLDGL